MPFADTPAALRFRPLAAATPSVTAPATPLDVQPSVDLPRAAAAAVREDERTLAKRDLRHHDVSGMLLLLDDYYALGDEIEEIPETQPPISLRQTPRAA